MPAHAHTFTLQSLLYPPPPHTPARASPDAGLSLLSRGRCPPCQPPGKLSVLQPCTVSAGLWLQEQPGTVDQSMSHDASQGNAVDEGGSDQMWRFQTWCRAGVHGQCPEDEGRAVHSGGRGSICLLGGPEGASLRRCPWTGLRKTPDRWRWRSAPEVGAGARRNARRQVQKVQRRGRRGWDQRTSALKATQCRLTRSAWHKDWLKSGPCRREGTEVGKGEQGLAQWTQSWGAGMHGTSQEKNLVREAGVELG